MSPTPASRCCPYAFPSFPQICFSARAKLRGQQAHAKRGRPCWIIPSCLNPCSPDFPARFPARLCRTPDLCFPLSSGRWKGTAKGFFRRQGRGRFGGGFLLCYAWVESAHFLPPAVHTQSPIAFFTHVARFVVNNAVLVRMQKAILIRLVRLNPLRHLCCICFSLLRFLSCLGLQHAGCLGRRKPATVAAASSTCMTSWSR